MEYQILIILVFVTWTLATKPLRIGYVTSNLINQPLILNVTPIVLSSEAIARAQGILDSFLLTFDSEDDRIAAMTNLIEADDLIKSSNQLYEGRQRNFLSSIYPFNILTPLQIEIRKTGSIARDLDLIPSRKRRSIPESEGDMCANLPESKNWTAEGVVSPPQDQGDCSNCYIFSSVSALESALAIATDTAPVKLSEQQLTDCVRNPAQPSPLGGCNRGRAEWVWNTTKTYNGAVKESSYDPYRATDDGGCDESIEKVPHTDVQNWRFNPIGDEEALKCALVKYGPHHISIDFSGPIANYKSGIYDDPTNNCNSSIIDGRMVKPYTHAVSLVGYGSELNNAGVMTDYWLIKNSYGPEWGIDGYIKIARNMNNLCHVATDAAVPILSSSSETSTSTTSSSTNSAIGDASPDASEGTTTTSTTTTLFDPLQWIVGEAKTTTKSRRRWKCIRV